MKEEEKKIILGSLRGPGPDYLSYKSGEVPFRTLSPVKRQILGYLCVLLALVSMVTGDTSAQLLGHVMPAIQLILHIYLVQLVVVLPIIIKLRGNIKVPLKTCPWLILFGVLSCLFLILVYQALRLVPAATFAAVYAVMLMMVSAVFSRIVLKEAITAAKVAAILIGSLGVILVLQPGGLFLPSPDATDGSQTPPDAANTTLTSKLSVPVSDSSGNVTSGPVHASSPYSSLNGILLAITCAAINAVLLVIQPSKLLEIKKQVLVIWMVLLGSALSLILLFPITPPVLVPREQVGLTVVNALGASLWWPMLIVAVTLVSPMVIACLIPVQLIIMYILQQTVLREIFPLQGNFPMEVSGVVLVAASAVLTPLFNTCQEINPESP